MRYKRQRVVRDGIIDIGYGVLLLALMAVPAMRQRFGMGLAFLTVMYAIDTWRQCHKAS